MKIYEEKLSDVDRYIENKVDIDLNDMIPKFEATINTINKFKKIDNNSKILEIGTGTGWFPILCAKHNIDCEGIEISPQLIEYAYEYGAHYGIQPKIRLGNIEENIGNSKYDIIIAQSVFEHVEFWENGLKNVFNALKPGGLFLFTSTNKYSIISGEYNLPFYGWLPDSFRYSLRKFAQCDDIMKLGIDFNQFTYPQLKEAFKEIGFSKVTDLIEYTDSLYSYRELHYSEKMILEYSRKNKYFKQIASIFFPMTEFICIK